MEDMKNNTDLQARVEECLLLGLAAAVVAVVAAFAVIVIGCAALPAVLARLFGWQWLLIYPGVFAACIFGAGRKMH